MQEKQILFLKNGNDTNCRFDLETVLHFLKSLDEAEIIRKRKTEYGAIFNISFGKEYPKSKRKTHFYIEYKRLTEGFIFEIYTKEIIEDQWVTIFLKYNKEKHVFEMTTELDFAEKIRLCIFKEKENDKSNNQLIKSFLDYLISHSDNEEENLFFQSVCDQYFPEKKEIRSESLSNFLCNNGIKTYFFTKDKTQKKENYNNYVSFNDKPVQQMVSIFPYAKSVIQNATCMMLDGTFLCCKPYTAAIGLVIIDNISIPIFLSIGPSESFLLFERAYKCLEDFGIDKAKLHGLPVISDDGKALKKFISHYGIINHCFCHRHIIENFGPKSKFGSLICFLLKQGNEMKFDNNLEYILNVFNNNYKTGFITKQQRTAFKELFCPQFINGTYIIDRESLNKIHKTISLFGRPGIPSTTNHIESIHSKCNKKIKEGKVKNIYQKIMIVMQYLLKKANKEMNELSGANSQNNSFISMSLKRYLSKVANDNNNTSPIYQCPVHCGLDIYYTFLFNSAYKSDLQLKHYIPCFHTYYNDAQCSIQCIQFDYNDYYKPDNNIFQEYHVKNKWAFRRPGRKKKNKLSPRSNTLNEIEFTIDADENIKEMLLFMVKTNMKKQENIVYAINEICKLYNQTVNNFFTDINNTNNLIMSAFNIIDEFNK